MGLLRRLLHGADHSEEVQYAITTRVERFGGEELVHVVGESNYQPAIRAACGPSVDDDDVLVHCMAELVPEPSNPYDSNAVRVDIEGQCVGYLGRSDAAELGPAIVEGRERQGNGLVRAVISGHKGGSTTNLGVFLHLRIERE